MPDSVGHRVAMHQLAQERRAAGKPVWERKINLSTVFHDEELTFEQKRDRIVEILRASSWFKQYGEGDYLPQLVEELADSAKEADFDMVFDAIYDIADYDRVWIRTII